MKEFRICKIECHPLIRYSYPGEGAIITRSIANYIIMKGKGKTDRRSVCKRTVSSWLDELRENKKTNMNGICSMSKTLTYYARTERSPSLLVSSVGDRFWRPGKIWKTKSLRNFEAKLMH